MKTKQCRTQKEIREFLQDVMTHVEITQCLNIVKLIGYCNAENLNGRVFIGKLQQGYRTVQKCLPVCKEI